MLTELLTATLITAAAPPPLDIANVEGITDVDDA